jgi:hypothetical protein
LPCRTDNNRVSLVKQYKTKNCKSYPVKALCTKAKYQKIIERHEFADALEINKENIAQNPEIYAQRQAIVEHPFGTMRRGWGFDHIMTEKFKERASSDVGFIFTAYNLRRLMNILGVNGLIKYLKKVIAEILLKLPRKTSFRLISPLLISSIILTSFLPFLSKTHRMIYI